MAVRAVRKGVSSWALISPKGKLVSSISVTVPCGEVSREPAAGQAPMVLDKPVSMGCWFTQPGVRDLLLEEGDEEVWSSSSWEDMDCSLPSEEMEDMDLRWLTRLEEEVREAVEDKSKAGSTEQPA